MITVQVDARQVTEALNRLIAELEEPSEALRGIGAAMVSRIDQGFRESTAPDGEAWEPLKLRAGQPLLDTGRLRGSIDWQLAGGDGVAIGTNVLYGVVHQFGATIEAQPGQPGENFIGRRVGARRLHWRIGGQDFYAKRVEVPARPFLPMDGLPEDWAAEIVELIGRHLQGTANG